MLMCRINELHKSSILEHSYIFFQHNLETMNFCINFLMELVDASKNVGLQSCISNDLQAHYVYS